MAVKTLTIDGKLVSAREGETILEAAREAGDRDPDALPFRRLVGRRRLPALPGRGSGKPIGRCRPA